MKLFRLRPFALVAACVAGLAVVSSAWAQDDPRLKRVDLFLRDADLLHATQALTLQTGIAFVIEPNSTGFQKINLNLPNVTAEEAIRYICQAAGAWAERDEVGVYVIRSGKPEKKPEKPIAELIVRRPELVKKIRLMKADPRTVHDMLLYGKAHDPISEINWMNDYFRGVNQSQSRLPGPQLTVISPGSSPVNYPSRSLDGARQNADLNSEVGSSIALPGESANQIVGGGGGQGGGQGSSQFTNPGIPGGGQDLGAGSGGGLGQGGGSVRSLRGGSGFVPQGIQFVSYDPTDNSLVVMGDEEAIRELERLVEMFDNAPRQVVIKIEFATINQDIDKQTGINWKYQRGPVLLQAGLAPAPSTDTYFLNYATGNISAIIGVTNKDVMTRKVSAPLIRTLNNQPASLVTSTTSTVFTSQIVNGPGGITVVPVPLSINTARTLFVRPRINGDNTITMGINTSIGEVTGFTQGPDGQLFPEQSNQAVNVVARVKSGETIALAGLSVKFDVVTNRRVPLLSELPLIGTLFRTRQVTKADQELIIFLTPTIVEEDNFGLGAGP